MEKSKRFKQSMIFINTPFLNFPNTSFLLFRYKRTIDKNTINTPPKTENAITNKIGFLNCNINTETKAKKSE